MRLPAFALLAIVALTAPCGDYESAVLDLGQDPGEALEAAETFAEVSSDFYPQLQAHYEHVIASWIRAERQHAVRPEVSDDEAWEDGAA